MTLWAIKDGKRIRAEPNVVAKCEICGEIVVPKCGKIKIWHFAHKSKNDCDDWYEPESEWHLNWKDRFPKEYQEIIIEKELIKETYSNTGIHKEYQNITDRQHEVIKHRADIKFPNGKVIEFQASSISSEQIKEREEFYGNMIWVLNGSELAQRLNLREKNNIITFRWKHPPQSWWFANKPIYIDLNYTIAKNGHQFTKEQLFLVKKIYHNCPCGGWGEIITKEEFIKRINNEK